MSTKSTASTTTALAVALFVTPILLLRYRTRQSKLVSQQRQSQSARRSTLSSHGRSNQTLRPPFPGVIRDALLNCRLSYLSTVDSDKFSSHLSLMRYTYLPEEEVILMSTNRQTKKFEMLQKQRGVALLIHDFAQFGDGDSGACSITLNGSCHIVEGPDEERYRQEHLKTNPDYPQFIVGEHIAMLCVEVTEARICNIQDQVTKWNVNDPPSKN